MAAMVATKWYLWLNLSGIKEREKYFLLDSLISPFGLCGTAVNFIVQRFRGAKVQLAAFEKFIPSLGQGPSTPVNPSDLVPGSSSWREGQKVAVAVCASPQRCRVVRPQRGVHSHLPPFQAGSSESMFAVLLWKGLMFRAGSWWNWISPAFSFCFLQRPYSQNFLTCWFKRIS